jgi:hypothetical protein
MTHPNYNPLTHENDFQLLHLSGWVNGKATIRINKNSTIPERLRSSDSVLKLVGMGRTEEDGPISDVLMKTTIDRVVDSSDCQDAYPEYLVNGDLVICATGDDSSKEGRDRYVYDVTYNWTDKKNQTYNVIRHLEVVMVIVVHHF